VTNADRPRPWLQPDPQQAVPFHRTRTRLHPAGGVSGALGDAMIRKLKSGEYRLYSRKTDPKTGKRKNLGTFSSREAAEKHEREVQYFKRR
jgi:hypothetical protein